MPPSFTVILMDVEPASRLFSMSSLSAEAGRCMIYSWKLSSNRREAKMATTSPAAMRLMTDSCNLRIGRGPGGGGDDARWEVEAMEVSEQRVQIAIDTEGRTQRSGGLPKLSRECFLAAFYVGDAWIFECRVPARRAKAARQNSTTKRSPTRELWSSRGQRRVHTRRQDHNTCLAMSYVSPCGQYDLCGDFRSTDPKLTHLSLAAHRNGHCFHHVLYHTAHDGDTPLYAVDASPTPRCL